MSLAIGDKTGRPARLPAPPAGTSGADNLIVRGQTSARSAAGCAQDQIRSPQPAPGLGQSAAAEPLRVLIVEDDRTIGPLLAEVLNDLGHAVCAIETDVGAAVASAWRYRPDLLIVDVKWDRPSGISAAREILEQGIVPHVFVTGDVVRNLSLGPAAVLIQKPYRASNLVTAIARATSRRSEPQAPH